MTSETDTADADALPPRPARVSLRSMYAAAKLSVATDPAAALVDYHQFLDQLASARRARGE